METAVVRRVQFPVFTGMILRRGEEIHYIGGADVLPAPLDIQTETLMIEKLQTDEFEEAKASLIEHNLRLVVYIAKKFDNTGVGAEDLISIGTIGLIKAINTFKSEKKIKLATYASRCIENEILMYLRKTSSLKNETSIDEPLNIDKNGNELLFCDVLGSDKDLVTSHLEQETECLLVRSAVENLSERDKLIMELRFGLAGKKEHTQKEVADLLGISQSYISRLEKRIIEKLKRDIEKVS